MKIMISCLLCISIGVVFIESCAPRYGLGIQNNTGDTLYFATTNYIRLRYPTKDSECEKHTILPGKFYCFTTTGGSAVLDTIYILFDKMQIIKRKDTISVYGRYNIFKMFRWDSKGRGAYTIVVNDSTFKK